eukprot:c11226_g1_i1.p1 GENE.c11226_g1_i1~~c11226_g1_i1.p1  ORF type:complete len:275 (+),score=86.99 c11226_g1_i1:236-1060(+)
MMTYQDEPRQHFSWEFSPERVRLVVYALFAVIVGLGFLLTVGFATHADLDHTALDETFGYSNVCLYFDFPPATYIMPTLWVFMILLAAVYLFGFWVRIKLANQAGEVSDKTMRTITSMCVFECTALAFSIQIFSNQIDESITMHTIPFMGFMIALVGIAGQNVWYFNKIGLFSSSPSLCIASWYFFASFSLVTILKLVVQINGLAGGLVFTPTSNGGKHFGHIIDVVWLALATVVTVAVTFFVELKGADHVIVSFVLATHTKSLLPLHSRPTAS